MIRLLFTQSFAAYLLLSLWALWQFGTGGLIIVIGGLLLLAKN